MASNVQQGTRGLSAGDWIRIKRLNGAKQYQTDKPDDIAPTMSAQLPYNKAMLIAPVVGTSRIRRAASSWTDYTASQTADYVLESGAYFVDPSSGTKTLLAAKTLTGVKVCNCTTFSVNKVGACVTCGKFVHKRLM